MDRLTSLTVCNVKGRFSVKAPKDLLFRRIVKPCVSRLTSNFSFVTIQGLKYSVFANSTQVNVTGLKRFTDFAAAAEEFCHHFGVVLDPNSFVVDCSTVVGQLSDVSRALLAEVASRRPGADEEEVDEVDYPHPVSSSSSGHRRGDSSGPFACVARTRWFPSIHLRPKKQQVLTQAGYDAGEPRLASCTVFPTGRIVILGARSLRDAHYTAMRASAYMFREPEYNVRLWDEVFYNEDTITDTYNPNTVYVPSYPDEDQVDGGGGGGFNWADDSGIGASVGGCEHQHPPPPYGASAVAGELQA